MSNFLTTKRLICFDLDGTLIDSVGVWNQVDCQLILNLTGLTTDESEIQHFRDHCLSLYKHYADPYLAYCECLKDKYQLDLTTKHIKQARYQISHDYLDQHMRLKDQAADVVHALKRQGYLLALCTTTSIDNIRRYQNNNAAISSQLHFENTFDLVLTREDVSHIKPNPEVYLRAMAHFDLAPEQCLVVEDAWVGIQAAQQANIEIIAIEDVYAKADRQHIQQASTQYFTSFADFLDIIPKNV
jgi:beta-phosphoglucomutase-like phosphatase (HAD superfamily)